MKQILLILIAVFLIACQKQQHDTYLIKGNVEEIPDSTVIDLYMDHNDVLLKVTSDTIVNGKFEFMDTLKSRPANMILYMRDYSNYPSRCELWVDQEEIEITGKGKYLSGWIVSGNNSELKALNRLKSKTREISVIMDSLRAKDMQNGGYSKQMRKTMDSLIQISFNIQFNLIEENPNSQSALRLLYRIAQFDTTIKKNRIKEIYNRMNNVYQNTIFGEGILSLLEEKEIPEIGDKMVNFYAHDIEGEKHSLDEFKGKYILLDFWSAYCGPCLEAIPETRKLHLNNKNILTVIGVYMDTYEDGWREATKKDSIQWVNLSDGKGNFAGISSDYGIMGFPTYILIDTEGIIKEKWMGYWPDIFKDKLSKHIKGLKI